MDTLTSMKVFHTAVTNGSFSEAGRVLGMAPSSVSRQISALEDHLGVQLLNRSTRQLHLTEAGETYHDRVINILQSVEDAAVANTMKTFEGAEGDDDDEEDGEGENWTPGAAAGSSYAQ